LSVYPDSSFLFPQYVADTHSQEADRRMAQRPTVLITPFHRAELASAIFQQVFRGRISAAEAQFAYASFEADCASGVWLRTTLPEPTFATCIRLARMHGPMLGVRTLDTLHVAAALELKAARFWTFDDRQARLAEAAGLATT
jgi:predicted nucleic acid-binding protein